MGYLDEHEMYRGIIGHQTLHHLVIGRVNRHVLGMGFEFFWAKCKMSARYRGHNGESMRRIVGKQLPYPKLVVA